MTHLDMSIDAARIKTLRDQRAWSQEQLAAVSGLSARTIQRLEAEGKASAESRMAIAAAFGMEPAQLLPGATADAATTGSEVPGDVAGGGAGATGALAAAGAAGSAAIGGAREDRLLKIALLVLLAILMVVWFGYTVGRDMARRDNARDAACATDDADCAADTRPATRQAP